MLENEPNNGFTHLRFELHVFRAVSRTGPIISYHCASNGCDNPRSSAYLCAYVLIYYVYYMYVYIYVHLKYIPYICYTIYTNIYNTYTFIYENNICVSLKCIPWHTCLLHQIWIYSFVSQNRYFTQVL